MHTLDCCTPPCTEQILPCPLGLLQKQSVGLNKQSGLPFGDFQNLDCLSSHLILLTIIEATCKGLKILLSKFYLWAKKSGQLVWTLKSRKIAMMCSAGVVDHNLMFSSFWGIMFVLQSHADDWITSETDITSFSLPPLLYHFHSFCETI